MLIRAPNRNGEVEMAKDLVDDVGMERGGPLLENVKSVDRQHAFWRAAGTLGLVAHDLESRIEAKRMNKARRL